MTSWASSRIVRQVLRIPLIGRLPLEFLKLYRQRATQFYFLLHEYGERLRSWWKTGLLLPIGLFRRDFLRLYFAPRVVLGRTAFEPRTPNHMVSGSALSDIIPSECQDPPAAKMEACVYVSRHGNFFHTEIAELLALGLESSGCFDVERRDESQEPSGAAFDLIVAPHEFFGLGEGTRFRGNSYRHFRRSSSLFLAEQPGSKYFSTCLPFVAESRRTFDLNDQSTRLLQGLGVDAHFLPVGYVDAPSLFDSDQNTLEEKTRTRGMSLEAAMSGTESDRPIDIAFTGVLTRRRADFFGGHADFFSSHRCVLALPTASEPLGGGVSSTLTTKEATLLSRRSKIVLNIHRNDRGYFEWHRIMIRGLWQQALVVTEPSPLPPGIIPGQHLIQAPLEEIPELLRWLLESEEGRLKAEAVRIAGYRLLLDRYDLASWMRGLHGLISAEQ